MVVLAEAAATAEMEVMAVNKAEAAEAATLVTAEMVAAQRIMILEDLEE